MAGLDAIIHLIIVLFAGLALGSFATALTYRVPRGIAWAGFSKNKIHRSACTHCKNLLRVFDLVPVLSYLLARGKCRRCNHDIGRRYLLIEVGVLFAVMGVYAAVGFTHEAAFIIVAIPFLAALLAIDLEHMILPNQLTAIVGFIGFMRLLAAVFIFESIPYADIYAEYFAGAVLYAAFIWCAGWMMTRIVKKDSLGFGDVKFFAVAGLWLGLSQLHWFCMLAGLLGVFFGLIWKKLKNDSVFPFGPALIASLYVLLILGGSLLG